jgi:hypothetical protein
MGEAITKLGWNVLPRPPYSLILVLSDFHFFGALKEVVHCKRIRNDEVIEEMTVNRKFKLVHEGDRCSCLLVQGC